MKRFGLTVSCPVNGSSLYSDTVANGAHYPETLEHCSFTGRHETKRAVHCPWLAVASTVMLITVSSCLTIRKLEVHLSMAMCPQVLRLKSRFKSQNLSPSRFTVPFAILSVHVFLSFTFLELSWNVDVRRLAISPFCLAPFPKLSKRLISY